MTRFGQFDLRRFCRRLVLGSLLLAPLAATLVSAPATRPGRSPWEAPPKQVIGAVAKVAEAQSELEFVARVDTGATTSSIHVDAMEIIDGAPTMFENLGKTIRFHLSNGEGGGQWLQRKIAEIATIKTSERAEMRYKVPLTLSCDGVEKNVLVSLNDRSSMNYPLLLGRNFLEGEFLVDVQRTASRQ